MAKRKNTAKELTKDAAATFAGLGVMGEMSKLVPAQGSQAVGTAYGVVGLGSTGMTLKAAKGVLDSLDEFGKKSRWEKPW